MKQNPIGRPLLIAGLVLLAAALAWAGAFYWRHFRGAGPAFWPPPRDITQIIEKRAAEPPQGGNLTGFPLTLPSSFTVSIFADNLDSPRVLALDPEGTLLASIPSQGRIVALPDKNRDGKADRISTVVSGLNRPHGFAFHPQNPKKLYIAEVQQLAIYDYDYQTLKAANKRKILDLPAGGRHWTRTLLFLPGPGGTGFQSVPSYRLLISMGSSCDTCVEKDQRHGTILVADDDGKNPKVFAPGLRNAVFMTRHPVTGQVWVTEMGRDFLGDDLPPDEINIVEEGKHYGWPWCYGKQVHDGQFDFAGRRKDFCKGTVPSYIDIPAHSAPLGLAFFPAASEWPKDYHYNLLVAYHGSWNRTIPTGYKVVRYKLDSQGKYLGEEDFITGWLTKAGALGRPADILIKPDGVMYISDDKAGVVYQVGYSG
ncbi:MAG: PQQ-dependent sugar dehydrogenase [Deltaproteobacteria bacterium]|nr:PQQ-dependent sugar dehydrogenase [Deltaproteobacteria bacterium]